MDCEVLFDPKMSKRGRAIIHAMFNAARFAGIRAIQSHQRTGIAPWLMTYGMGHSHRKLMTQAHTRAGGRVIGWDLGYWNRDHNMRLTIDQDHPQHLIEDRDPSRFDSYGIQLRDDYKANGPIIIAGLGAKSRKHLGYRGMEWEQKMLAKVRSAYPGARILYRSKRPEHFSGCPAISGAIEQALKGASLVVCHHSNVAVDACIAGVPVVCADGAAAALYNNDLSNPVIPSYEERLRFLRNLAWWQWHPSEAKEAWTFIKAILT